MNYSGRQRTLLSALARNHLDALLITHLANIRYLCGFTGSSGALILSQPKSILFTDGRYKEQARTEVKGASVAISRKSPLAAAGEWLSANRKKLGVDILGIEAQHLTVADHHRLRECMGSHISVREASTLVEQARMVKDEDEIARLRAAVQLGASLFDIALKTIRPGIAEVEVAAEMEYAARRLGAEAMSFETIIASGTRSAMPHGRASAAQIPANGFVVCDFGIILTGYCSDMTRTVHIGKPSDEALRMYGAVREAQQAALAAVKPGVRVSRVDAAARRLLIRKGYGRYFTHSTGHGVGLEIHEPPRIAARQIEVLRPGMVVTVEPGAYIQDRGGVRIEDMVLVTENGSEVLTPTSKELIII